LSDWFNAIIGILICPAEGCGGFVVLPDVRDQLLERSVVEVKIPRVITSGWILKSQIST
jgi:hypothetical protein